MAKMKKVIIITGINGGIGKACADYLASKGNVIYGISRSIVGDEKYPTYCADVNDYQRITDIFKEIYKLEKRIDVLINVAGYGIAGSIESTPCDEVYKLFDTNISAVVCLSHLAIPYLKQTKGNLINISSVGGIAPLPYQACYSASKSAVEIFSRALDGEVKKDKIKVTVVLPGDLKTTFTSARKKYIEGDENSIKRQNRAIAKMEKAECKGQDPIIVAKAIYRILKKKRPPLRKTVGFVYKFVAFLLRILPLRFVNFLIRHIYC